MEHLGYNLVYNQTFDVTQQDFNQNVIAMRNDGVKILFIEQMPQNYAGAVIQALNQQNFHPVVVLGASTYSEQLVSSSGGAASIDGSYMEQNAALYLGEDEAALPAVNTFLTWIQKAQPGFHPDLYPSTGGSTPSCSYRPCRRPGPTPAAGQCSRPFRRSRPSRAGTSSGRPTRPRRSHRIATSSPGLQRPDPPAGRSADRRVDPRLPLRSALLLQARLTRRAPSPPHRTARGAPGAAVSPRPTGRRPSASTGPCGWPPDSCG